MQTIKQTFKTILTGNEVESKNAARSVRKLTYGSAGGENKHVEIQEIIETVEEVFENIEDLWRKENYIVAMSVIYFLHNRENKPDFLFPFFLKLIENNNGVIRQMAVKMIIHELGSLTVHLRHPSNVYSISRIKYNDMVLVGLHNNLFLLSQKYYLKSYRKVKYVQDLKPSVYKSAQLVLGEIDEMTGKTFAQ